MSVDQHINVTVTINNTGISRQGFGTIGMLSYKSLFPERSRTYQRVSDAVADGFAATSPEILAASAIMGQSPHPISFKILRGSLPPTQRYVLAATAGNSTPYAIEVKGEGVTTTDVSYTSDSSATLAEIHNALRTQLNAVVGKNYTVTFAALTFADATFTAEADDDTLTFGSPHTLLTGDGPFQVSNSGGALPAGLVALTDYWFIRTGANTGKLATSLANALAGTAIDLTTDGTGTQTMADTVSTVSPAGSLTATADAAGNWFSLAVADTSVLSITQNHTDPGVGTDLAAIYNQDPDFYYVHTFFNSENYVKAVALWTEATSFKAYFVDVVDSASENVAAGGGDVLDDLEALEYKRTLYGYHRKPAEMWSAGWMGRLAPLNVGRWTAAYKTIVGSTVDRFTATQTTNLDAKKASYYKQEAGRSITWEGKVANASYAFMDVTVSLDFMLDEIQKRALGAIVALDKVSYTDEDIAVIRGAIEGAVSLGKSDAHKIIAPGTPGDPNDPQPVVSFPKVRDIDPSVRSLRKLPNGAVNFRLQGAIHTVDVALTVTF